MSRPKCNSQPATAWCKKKNLKSCKYYLAKKYRHKRFLQYLCLEQKIDKKIGKIQKQDQISDWIAPTVFFYVKVLKNDRQNKIASQNQRWQKKYSLLIEDCALVYCAIIMRQWHTNRVSTSLVVGLEKTSIWTQLNCFGLNWSSFIRKIV